MWSIFPCTCQPFVRPWGDVHSGPLPIFNLVICVFLLLIWISSLYILHVNLLLHVVCRPSAECLLTTWPPLSSPDL